jgi:hypothetical protein
MATKQPPRTEDKPPSPSVAILDFGRLIQHHSQPADLKRIETKLQQFRADPVFDQKCSEFRRHRFKVLAGGAEERQKEDRLFLIGPFQGKYQFLSSFYVSPVLYARIDFSGFNTRARR